MIKLLGIYGSPRKGGNSDILLDKAISGAKEAGAEVKCIYVRDLKIGGCLECGGCDKTGVCIIDDDMRDIYPLLQDADAILLAAPVFFYGLPSQAKALVDRAQAMWSKRMLEKSGNRLKEYDSGMGYMVSIGATKGQNLFEGIELTAKYFYDALDMEYKGGLFFKRIEGEKAILKHEGAIEEAFALGKKIAG